MIDESFFLNSIDDFLKKLNKLDPLKIEEISEQERQFSEQLLEENVIKHLLLPDVAAKKAKEIINRLLEDSDLTNVLNIFKISVFQIFQILPVFCDMLNTKEFDFNAEYIKNNNGLFDVKWDDGNYNVKEILKITKNTDFPNYPLKYQTTERLFHTIITSSNGVSVMKSKIQNEIDKDKDHYHVNSLIFLVRKMINLSRLGKNNDFFEFLNEKMKELMTVKLKLNMSVKEEKDKVDVAPKLKLKRKESFVGSLVALFGIPQKKCEIESATTIGKDNK